MSSSVFSWKLLPPEVMDICDVSEDRLEWPFWQDNELRDLASVSISLQERKTDNAKRVRRRVALSRETNCI
jgi:hypothetical protein